MITSTLTSIFYALVILALITQGSLAIWRKPIMAKVKAGGKDSKEAKILNGLCAICVLTYFAGVFSFQSLLFVLLLVIAFVGHGMGMNRRAKSLAITLILVFVLLNKFWFHINSYKQFINLF